MPALASLPHHRLLVSLLVALAATACAEDRTSGRFVYTPGSPGGGTHKPSPAGPCASASDPALPGYLGFFCMEDARIEAGPIESTDARGARTCAYDVSWLKEGEKACATPGRPLLERGRPVLASLRPDASWSMRSSLELPAHDATGVRV